MELEKFRTTEGIFLRAKNKTGKMLFRHCAGADIVPNRNAKEVEALLFLHGVEMIETYTHSSVNKK